MTKKSTKAKQAALKYGYRSGLEETIAKQIGAKIGVVSYEPFKIQYQKPTSKYTPDFVLPSGIIIETKGRFVGADRSKHLLVKKQHPKLDIRFVFTNANQKLTKASKTTYGQWCDKHGFKWAVKLIPEEWFDEK